MFIILSLIHSIFYTISVSELNAVVGVLYLVRRYKGRTDSQWFNLVMNFNEYTSHYTQYACSAKLNAVVGVLYLVRRYKGRTDSQWFNLVMNFNEYTSHYTQYACSAKLNAVVGGYSTS
ncbi:hypothetical protein V1477_007008 [Vespula maculifrons]|uniref:Uncharacterized protein n=1 Tax=Vespula maculifrons TaxID=7453 RepID=A0ABD2CHI2_VESMC